MQVRTDALRGGFLMIAVVHLLAGCGGGGGGSASSAPQPNRAPQLATTSIETDEDEAFSGKLNATDPDQDAVVFEKTSDPEHGRLTLASDGSVSYSPAEEYNGSDSFSVQVRDTRGASSTATVSLTIRAVNDAPRIQSEEYSGDEESIIEGQITATDAEADEFTITLAAESEQGSLALEPNGEFSFQPRADFFGTATFDVLAEDVQGAAETYTIAITVLPVNDGPIAHDDELRISSGSSLLSLLANDVDADGDNLAVEILSQPQGGTVSVTNSNTVTFDPENEYEGPATFTYRITDAAGLTADATARLVVGDFPGIVFLADETIPGIREVHHYDGFRTTRINPPLRPDAYVAKFWLAMDATHLAYVVRGIAFDQVFSASIDEPGTAKHIYTTASMPAWAMVSIALNQNGSYALIKDPSAPSTLKTTLVRTSDSHPLPVGTTNAELMQMGEYMAFNPVLEEFYVQAQIGGSASMASTGMMSLYRGTLDNPETLEQLGSSGYPTNNGSGSGFQIAPTPNGERVLHLGVAYQTPTPGITWNLLVNDRVDNAETNIYRPLAPYEYHYPITFDLSKDGSRVCFILNDPPGTVGPGSIWINEVAQSANGTRLSPAMTSNFGCAWAADNRNVVYSANGGSGKIESWIANTDRPGEALRVREPLEANEELDYVAVASGSMSAVLGTRNIDTGLYDFYVASLSEPGRSDKFCNDCSPSSGALPSTINAQGTLMAHARSVPIGGGLTMSRLHLLSTRLVDYEWTLARPDASAGVSQFEFLPVR